MTRLRWEHVHDDHFEIDGKRGPHDAPRPRAFPLLDRNGNEWIPGLTSLLAELRVFEFDNDGYIFPWRNVKYMQRAFGICRDACGLHDGRSLYNFRKAAIWYWQEALKLPIEVTSAVAGHRPDVDITHYRLKNRKREVQSAVTEARRERLLSNFPLGGHHPHQSNRTACAGSF